VLVNGHGGDTRLGPNYAAARDELQANPLVQLRRPTDKDLEMIAAAQIFVGREQQAPPAHIHGLPDAAVDMMLSEAPVPQFLF
jgi:hypothetical protein